MAIKEKNKEHRIKKVIKLGGSCLVDAASIKKAASLLKEEAQEIAVVVSALKGITDLLLEAYFAAFGQSRDFHGLLASIKKRHEQIALELLPLSLFNRFQTKLQEIFNHLIESLNQLFLDRKTSPDLKARILSSGERLSGYLLSTYLEASGIRARVYETDKIGLVAIEELGKVRVNLEKFEVNFKKVTEEIDENNFLPIFTGFFGSNERGEIVLFGRNGSDYSAAVIARGFRAKILELYKDVPGVFTADPSLIPESKLIPHLSREEAAELSFYGAKIIHPYFWQPLEGCDTEVRIKGFDSPELSGTIISKERKEASKEEEVEKNQGKNNLIIGFSLKENVILLKIQNLGVQAKKINLPKLERTIAAIGGQIIATFSQSRGLILVLSKISIETLSEIISSFRKKIPLKFCIESNLALIAALSQGIRQNETLKFRILNVLAREKIAPPLLACLENWAILLIVKSEESLRALRALHTEFFATAPSAKTIFPDAHLLVG